MASTGKIEPYLRPHRTHLLLSVGFAFVTVAMDLLKPWPLKVVFDHVIARRPLAGPLSSWSPGALLAASVLAIVILQAGQMGAELSGNYLTTSLCQKMVNELRSDLYRHLGRLSLSYFTRSRVGELTYRVAYDTYSIQALVMNALFPALFATLLLAGIFFIALRLDPLLTLVALALCPLLALSIALLGGRIERTATLARQRESGLFDLVQRTLASMRVVQAFSREPEEHRRFVEASRETLGSYLRLYLWQTLLRGLGGLIVAAGTALVVWVGARHVLEGRLTIGALVVFLSYLASLPWPVRELVSAAAVVQESRVGVRRVFEILDADQKLRDGQRPLAGRARGAVRFSGVTFGYEPGRPVLRNIDLEVPAGQSVAIVGPTGAGKSTLAGLVPRFFDPDQGEVAIDGEDVRRFRLSDLRRQVALVPQPPLVFPGTIAENIAYGRPGSSPEAIRAVARAAQIHDFIASLPQGYDTPVGEQGATLSEGEKQRLTIARAILCDAPILVLDEPTSAVDAVTELQMLEALKSLLRGRTAFIIAHRLSVVRQVDRILFLRDGRIEESGPFSALSRSDGPFGAFYRAQFGERAVATGQPMDAPS